ncbi:MAG TPA: hypothetical protein VND87_05585 [Stellaceae bacterium]|nr:hypothetical protein [Stellaceae bacterium]
MKSLAYALFFAGTVVGSTVFASTAALADADDAKWVAQCVQDNADAKVSIEIVTKYCTCMNDKMSSNETRSITQWEKTHVAERHACDRQAGWR